ncbi:MAG: c-type cytochrome [Alphaproteobacteria bacterium]|jgi:cytochrome c553|nr:c-type cytochrome [Alphaproteobacteria bacterium]
MAQRGRRRSRRPLPAAAAALLTLAASLAAAQEAGTVRELVKTECAHCHGEDGNSVAPTFPKLAGLQHDYLAKQLNDYRRGQRQSEVMGPIVETLSGRQIQDLAEYFSRQRREIGTSYIEGMVPLGRQVYHEGDRERGVPACAGCHKPDGTGTQRSPLIAGQNSAYVLQQLRAFHNDQRTNDRGQLMRTTAARMTEQEMVAVSEYVAGMDLIPSQP